MKTPEKITVRGRVDHVSGEITVGRKRYLVLERLANERVRVFDPAAGFHGDYRVVHFLPRGRATEQQIEVLRRLAEKNLHFPKIHECGRQGDRLAVVSSWIWGTNLREVFREIRERKRPRPSTREACRLVNKLAHGLAYLHNKANVVHGDVKPANIVLENDPARLVLIDFGSAWPAERAAKKNPGDGVSVPYSAPEQLIPGAVPDFRADVFALTVVLYEWLTWEIPFAGVGGQAGLPEHKSEFPSRCEPPSRKMADTTLLPATAVRALDAFAQKGLALTASDRFGNRRDWLDSFDDIVHQFRDGTRLGFFGRVFLRLFDRWSGGGG